MSAPVEQTAPSSPPRRENYSPVVSSPLNPSSPDTIPRRNRKRRALGLYKPNGSLSPTHRLLRQKAALAWRSAASQDIMAEAVSLTRKDRREGTFSGRVTEKPYSYQLGQLSPQRYTRLNSDYLTLLLDLEKQAPAPNGTGLTTGFQRESAPTCGYAPRPRRRSIFFNTRSILLLLAFICSIGVFCALRRLTFFVETYPN